MHTNLMVYKKENGNFANIRQKKNIKISAMSRLPTFILVDFNFFKLFLIRKVVFLEGNVVHTHLLYIHILINCIANNELMYIIHD